MICSFLSAKIKLLRTQARIKQLLKSAPLQQVCHYLSETMPFYAVKVGKTPGIYSTWDECQSLVAGFQGAIYKKFLSREDALDFITPAPAGPQTTSPVVSRMISIKGVHSVSQLRKQRAQQKSPKLSKPALPPASTIADDSSLGVQLNHLSQALNSVKDEASSLTQQCSSSVQNLTHAKKLVQTLERASTQLKEWNASLLAPALPALSATSVPNQLPPPKTSDSVPVVYTDGCCISNGRKRAAAGLGVFWGRNDPRNVAERIPGRQTNNRAEILAAEKAIRQAKESGYSRLELKTDSQFLINCITKWIPGWKRKGWKTADGKPVLNRDELERLVQTMQDIHVNWVHVSAHIGIDGNEMADLLSKEGAMMPLPEEA